jgi:hypothetical protein
MPLSLSDDEYAAVQAAAAPIHPHQRDDFLRALAAELDRHSVVSPGLLHRLAADLQRRFTVEARASAEAERFQGSKGYRGPRQAREPVDRVALGGAK